MSRGFTMLEVVIVIAIIAILATLALPSQMGAVNQRRIVETLELVEPYKAIIATHYRNHGGEFPEDNAAVGLPEPEKIIGNYLRKMEIREGVMHLHLGQKIPDKLRNKIVSIRPVYVPDSVNSPISWICGHNEIPPKMVAAGRDLTDLEHLFLPGRCR